MHILGPFQVLAIDDDPESLTRIKEALVSQRGLEVLEADSAEAGFEIFLRKRPRLVLLDLAQSSVSGMEVLERILRVDPGANVILISAHYSAESAVDAISKGACDYLTKPLDADLFRARVESFKVESELRQRTRSLDRRLLQACQFEGIVSRSPLMFDVFTKIRRVAPHFKTALVTGATGTGKELIARALYRLSSASRHKFVVCNCSTLVETLADSELFGYVRGAFTGANQDRPGLFENADGGLMFLDEVAELTPATQAKLLRVLQDHQVRRVGSSTSIGVDVRVVAATNRDLRAMVRDGQFREDLYYRLAVVEIPLPPLVDRREDLPLLENHFIARFSSEYKKSIAGLTRRAQGRMATYPWPGNIRELENVIGNACMMTDGRFIDINDLPERLRDDNKAETPMQDSLFSLAEVQRRHIMQVLERVGGNKARAAEILGVGRATIYQLLSRMRLEKSSESA